MFSKSPKMSTNLVEKPFDMYAIKRIVPFIVRPTNIPIRHWKSYFNLTSSVSS